MADIYKVFKKQTIKISTYNTSKKKALIAFLEQNLQNNYNEFSYNDNSKFAKKIQITDKGNYICVINGTKYYSI
jgi:hypothetical protein